MIFNTIVHEGETLQLQCDNSFCVDVSLNTKVPTAMLDDTKESNTGEEDNPRDNVALFDKCPKRDTSVHKARVTSSYIVFDPGPYLDYVTIYAIDSTFGDGKSIEDGAVTILFERPDGSFCSPVDNWLDTVQDDIGGALIANEPLNWLHCKVV
ncbi:hypothetical protein KY289_009428 [Solanum tuberosum]|nr:hypothetical protein KY289_009428 [Solanum tuberosum]